MFNKRQRQGLIVLAVVIFILQVFIVFSRNFKISNKLELEDSLIVEINKMHIEDSLKENKIIKYFRFNPNKLEYSYWSYFGLHEDQLYSLDSFRSKYEFENYKELKSILNLNKYQDSIFSSLVYFKKKPKKRKWKSKKRYQEFNPNSNTLEDWVSLNFSAKQAKIIVDYISKYGPISSKQQLSKIYVINDEKMKELWNYIVIPDSLVILKHERNINLCTISDLKHLSGLSEKESSYIIAYRDRLGGFKYKYQLKEVKLLNMSLIDSVQKYFYIDVDFHPLEININKASLEELDNHPYINRRFAMKIVEFRTNFRDYKSVEELKNIESLSDTYFDKIALYLSAD